MVIRGKTGQHCYDEAMDRDFAVIESQQLPNKLSIAGGGDYDKIWIRDNVYVALAFIEAGHIDEGATIYAELCKIIQTHEKVLNRKAYPKHDTELLHPRFTISGANVPGHWSNKQHDAVGALLFGIGKLHSIDSMLVTDSMKKICQKLINYLETCKYWEDHDNGIWEERLALHASSLAACIRGLEMVDSFCDYNKQTHDQAKENLEALLPRESSLHKEDMALLTLIWPYGYKRADLLRIVESRLLRPKGVIRYIGDEYEAAGQAEPQWVMGLPWLGVAHYELGDIQKAEAYLKETEELYTEQGLPESYTANNEACMHTPLAWSHAMAIVLRAKLTN